jgi:hypothetical protein
MGCEAFNFEAVKLSVFTELRVCQIDDCVWQESHGMCYLHFGNGVSNNRRSLLSLQTIMDTPPGVPGVSKNPQKKFANKSVELLHQ